MTSIKRCTSAEQAGWLALRMALWPAERDEHREEMRELCAQAGLYAQFLACPGLGEPRGLVEVALHSDYLNGTGSSPLGSWKASTWIRLHRALEFDERSGWFTSARPLSSD